MRKSGNKSACSSKEEGGPSKKRCRMEKKNPEIEVAEVEEEAVWIHPLLVDHVIEKVLGYLVKKSTPKELLGCREVCKTWCQVGTKMYQNSEENRQVRFGFGDTNRLKGFLSAMGNTNNLPLQRYQFDVNFFIRENKEIFIQFIKTCGPFITNLALSFGKNFIMSRAPQVFQNVDFSSLKSLSFNCSHLNIMKPNGGRKTWSPSSHTYDNLRYLLRSILESAPDLQHLNFDSSSFDHISTEDSTKFGDLLAETIPTKVTSLIIFLDMGEEQLNKLRMRNLKLDLLNLDFLGPTYNTEAIEAFLTSQKGTLKTLKIPDLPKTFSENLDSPKFNKLQVLEKVGNNPSLSYLKSFPYLKKLILRSIHKPGGIADSFHVENGPDLFLPTVNELDMREVPNMTLMVKTLSQCCPNIKKLRLQLHPAESYTALQTVFEVMPFLEELCVRFPHFFRNLAVDTIFTGIPVEICRNMLEKKSFTEIELDGVIRKPNINSLAKLKKLSVRTASYAVVLTNVTAVFGLLSHPSLEELQISALNITRDYFQRLENRLRVKELVKDTIIEALQQRDPQFLPWVCLSRFTE